MAQDSIEQLLEQAKRLYGAKDFAGAEGVCRQVLQADPANTKALHLLGHLALQGRRPEISADLLRQAAALEPANPEIQVDLGIALLSMRRADQAIAAFERAIAARPDYVAAHHNLSVVLRQTGQIEKSIAALRQVIGLRPDLPEAHAALADALWQRGDLVHAMDACRKAIVLRPQSAEYHNQLGILLRDSKRIPKAIAAYQKAIQLRPNFALAYGNLANALKDAGEIDQATDACRQALVLGPDVAEFYNILGNLLNQSGRIADSLQAFNRAIQIKPEYLEAHQNLIFSLHFQPDYDAARLYEAHRQWNQAHGEPLARFIPQRFERDRTPDRRLRIGYVSSGFRHHVVGFNVLPMLLYRDRDQFHVACYSNVKLPDDATPRFRASADEWREIFGRPDAEVAEQIVRDQIDILVDLDVHTQSSRVLLFARKPAPIQVTFAGYPGTTGLTTIDYRLTDPYLDPPGLNDAFYSEQSVRLPDSFWIYDPMTSLPAVSELPALKGGPMTFGCLCNLMKVNDQVLQCWSQVLRAVPGSKLILLAPRGQHRGATIKKLGVTADRVEFVDFQPRPKYLEVYRRIDIGLDTFPYNGHTTSLDATWMGVPVVSLCGQTAVSRGIQPGEQPGPDHGSRGPYAAGICAVGGGLGKRSASVGEVARDATTANGGIAADGREAIRPKYRSRVSNPVAAMVR